LIATRQYRASKTYNLKNKDDQARSVLIEHPFRADWDLIEPKDPFERTPTVYRFRVEVEPNATAKLVVREQRTADQHVVLRDTGLDQIQLYVGAKVISPEVRDALTQVVQMRTKLDETTRRKTELEARVQEIGQDQSRLRENIRTVRQATDLYNRYIEKLEAQETELDRIREEITRLTQQENEQRGALDQFLLSLSVT
jgi:DNA repair exonuclease SbcCD ATPase subunit